MVISGISHIGAMQQLFEMPACLTWAVNWQAGLKLSEKVNTKLLGKTNI